jgi:diguanylate cyclase (GGDEF)-like protein
MSEHTAALATQQLAAFLAVVSAYQDGPSALRAAIERAASALEAELGAVVCEGELVASVGYPRGAPPDPKLIEVAAGRRDTLQIPGAGTCHAVAAALGGTPRRHLIVARSGDDPFTGEEVNLLRGMARVLELTLEMLRTLEAERSLRERGERQAAENARLLASLQARQRLLERLSEIQRAISRRAPLQDVLDLVTCGARELLGDDVVALRLAEGDDPADTQLVAWHGPGTDRDECAAWLAGVPSPPHDAPVQVGATLATPVYESGRVVGSLVAGTWHDERSYSESDRAVLLAFAEHVSLAVTDAKTLADMHAAFHDSLTGLASRTLFLDRLEYALVNAARSGTTVALLFVDLDHFKRVNDTLGHAAGDRLLIEVADRLRHCLRASDTAARLGGDEFVVLLHVATADDAAIVADRILEALSAPVLISGVDVDVSASIGIAASVAGAVDGGDLLRNADAAMYRAKRAGKGRHETFETGTPICHPERRLIAQ